MHSSLNAVASSYQNPCLPFRVCCTIHNCFGEALLMSMPVCSVHTYLNAAKKISESWGLSLSNCYFAAYGPVIWGGAID